MKRYDHIIKKLRLFFSRLGYKEIIIDENETLCDIISVNIRNAILYNHNGTVTPLPQSRHLLLKLELLKNPQYKGLYTITNVYKSGINSEMTSDNIYPLFEFVSSGNMEDLIHLNLQFSKFIFNTENITIKHYSTISKYCDIRKENYTKLCNKYCQPNSKYKILLIRDCSKSDVDKLCWKYSSDDTVYKTIDMLVNGIKIMESGERDGNTSQIILEILTHNDYIDQLCSLFSKEKVDEVFRLSKMICSIVWIKGGINILDLINVIDV